MEHQLEPRWLGAVRKALMVGVTIMRGDCKYSDADLEEVIQQAAATGWPMPTDDYRDFWGTARAIAGLDGSLKQFPVAAFLAREVRRAR
jgi:hypothetical protein